MDAKVLFWAAAVLNFTVLTGFAFAGVRQARRGEYARHRRSMKIAAAGVGLFLVAYVAKLNFLGREDLHSWAARDVNVLRFHEMCVLAMLIGGGLALYRGRALARSRRFTRDPDDPQAEASVVQQHRIAGRTALVGAALGLASAILVWLGMWARTA